MIINLQHTLNQTQDELEEAEDKISDIQNYIFTRVSALVGVLRYDVLCLAYLCLVMII